jgi:disulfide bond formation protein DsbB
MARYPFNEDNTAPDWRERGQGLTQFIVRGFGFVLMLVGLWISLAVIAEAWSLYKNPANIERLAKAIERGSNLDHALSRAGQPERSTLEDAAPDGAASAEMLGFRMTYFVAWIIAILLLMLVGRLALGAVKTGGELVLHDVQIKQFARELVRETARLRPPG